MNTFSPFVEPGQLRLRLQRGPQRRGHLPTRERGRVRPQDGHVRLHQQRGPDPHRQLRGRRERLPGRAQVHGTWGGREGARFRHRLQRGHPDAHDLPRPRSLLCPRPARQPAPCARTARRSIHAPATVFGTAHPVLSTVHSAAPATVFGATHAVRRLGTSAVSGGLCQCWQPTANRQREGDGVWTARSIFLFLLGRK